MNLYQNTRQQSLEKILIIEDDTLVRNSLADLLSSEGYECFEANDGLSGLKTAREVIPDLIICDIKMPKMTGHEVLQEIRQDPKLSVQPFIFITAVHRDNKDQRYGMALGADDYIIKPFDEEDLLSSIKSRLQKHSEIKKKFESLRKSIEVALPHELQTPLVSIVGYSNLLVERLKQLNDSEGVEFATIINEAGLRLNRLIQKFITYTKFELRTRDAESTSLNIASTIIPVNFISEICFKVAERYRRTDDLKLDLRDVAARILSDDLHIIIEELLDNAFKFSKPGTEVKLSCYQGINKFYLKVTDHGRGISQEQLSAIDAYQQFERETYEQQGLGLGLIIVKKIIGYYDGSLSIKSEYGNYTITEVYLPSTNVFN